MLHEGQFETACGIVKLDLTLITTVRTTSGPLYSHEIMKSSLSFPVS